MSALSALSVNSAADLDAPLLQAMMQALPANAHRLAIAYSGGLDSSVLLHLAIRLAQMRDLSLHALHIHHGLSPHADAWSQHCVATCAALGVPCTVQRVQLQATAQRGVEEAARLARYAALGQLCRTYDLAYVMTAQHLDDQAETVLLQLLRGSGVAGLRGMETDHLAPSLLQNEQLRILRPLLGIARQQLEVYAKTWQVRHIEDESNANPRFARNALRLQVMPELEQAFPGFAARIARTALHMQAAQNLLQQLAAQDWQACALQDCLSMPALRALDEDRRDNLLRYWLAQYGWRMPSTDWMHELWQQIRAPQEGAQVCVSHADGQLRVYRERLYLTARLDLQKRPQQALDFVWQGQSSMDFPAWHGRLHFQRLEADVPGLSEDWLRRQTLQLHYRGGGERLKLSPKRPSRSLKQHYQAADIPPWRREYEPLISCQQQLLFAPGLGLACQFTQTTDVRVGLRWEAY